MSENNGKPYKYWIFDGNSDRRSNPDNAYAAKFEALDYVFNRATEGLHFEENETCEKVFETCTAYFADELTSLCEYVPYKKFEETLTKLRDITERTKKRKLEEIKTTRSQKLKSLYAELKDSAKEMSLSPEENAMVSRLGSPEQLVYNEKTANDVECQCQRTIEILLKLSIACPSVFYQNKITKPKTKLVRVFDHGDDQIFVLQEELHFALHGIEPVSLTLQDRMRNLYTYTFEDAKDMAEHSEEEIEFLWLSDDDFYHVHTLSGEVCDFATDILSKIIRETFDEDDYHSIDRFLSDSDEFEVYFETLRKFFECDDETPVFFMSVEAMEVIRETLVSSYKGLRESEIPKCFEKKVEEVTAKMEEFREKNPSLCLLKVFPELEGFFHSQKDCEFHSMLECCRPKDVETKNLEAEYDRIEKEMEETAEEIKNFWAENPTKIPKSSKVKKVVQEKKESKLNKADKDSTTKCDKCYRTSQYCEEAKKELKKSQNAVNKLEQKVSENEKAVKELAECKKKMAEMEQEMKQLRKTVEDSEKKLKDDEKKLKDSKKTLKTKEKENENLQKTTTLLEEELAKVDEELSSYKPMSQEARNNVISNIEKKLKVLDAEQPLQKADEKLRSLNRWLTSLYIKKQVKKDFETFQEQIDEFRATLHSIRDTLNENPHITRRELSDVPTCPEQPERLRRMHQEMLDEQNTQTDAECYICRSEREDGEEVVTCRCGKITHLACQRNCRDGKCGSCRVPLPL